MHADWIVMVFAYRKRTFGTFVGVWEARAMRGWDGRLGNGLISDAAVSEVLESVAIGQNAGYMR